MKKQLLQAAMCKSMRLRCACSPDVEWQVRTGGRGHGAPHNDVVFEFHPGRGKNLPTMLGGFKGYFTRRATEFRLTARDHLELCRWLLGPCATQVRRALETNRPGDAAG